MNRTFPSWNRPRQPAVAGSTRAVDPSAQRADGYRLLVAVVVLDLGELGIDHVVALRRLAARIARGTGVARRLLRGGHGREQRLRGFLQRLGLGLDLRLVVRSEEHTSELQSLMRISYAVFCLKKKTTI